MTALAQYQRLEAAGTWRPGPLAQRREVIVSFGDATLILSDPRSEVPLSHWSLPAVQRLNPGVMPALYSPGAATGEEELELSDPLMIEAIARVHHAIARARPHPGRLRGGVMLLTGLLVAGALIWWFPAALLDHAVRIAPPAQRAAIGDAVLRDMERLTGPACNRPAPAAVLGRLGPRLIGPGARLAILPEGLKGARALPGSLVVLGRGALTGDSNERDAALGHILAAATAAQVEDPLRPVLARAGTRAVLRLLTSGSLPDEAVRGYGEALLAAPEPLPDDDALLDRFARAGLPSEPYARDRDPSGESTLPLIEADPFRTREPPAAILSAEEWQVLKGICDQ